MISSLLGAAAITIVAALVLAALLNVGTQPTTPEALTRLALTVAAGVGGVVALVVAYRRQRDLEQGRFLEAFGAAAAQLGDSDVAVRLAGVYAMAGVADQESELKRQQCVNVLCGYLRLPYSPELGDNHQSALSVRRPVLRKNGSEEIIEFQYRQNDKVVRQAIVRVITAHLQKKAPQSWSSNDFDFTEAHLEQADFENAIFSGNTSFEGATFSGNTSFDGAAFSGEITSFEGAAFSGQAISFDHAAFSGQAISFDHAAFSGQAISFDHAAFSGQIASFYGATFSGQAISFDHADFGGKTMRFDRVTFSGGDLTSFHHSAFSGGDLISFDRAAFSGEITSFDHATFSGKTIRFCHAFFRARDTLFDRATFSGGETSFVGATWSGDTSFFDVDFGVGRVDFEYPQAGNPLFDWDKEGFPEAAKPSNVIYE